MHRSSPLLLLLPFSCLADNELPIIKPPFGGKLLHAALLDVLGPAGGAAAVLNASTVGASTREPPPSSSSSSSRSSSSSSSDSSSKVRIRCRQYLGCEYPLPAVEIDHAVFLDGTLYLTNVDAESRRALRDTEAFYAARKGFLPSALVQYRASTEWLHGPAIVLYNESDVRTYPQMPDGSYQPLPACTRQWDTSAYFLHPWESSNSFHSFNDNVLAVLATVVLQHVVGADRTAPADGGHRTLFMFRKESFSKRSVASQLFKLLFWVFEGDVREAAQVLEGGPHCVRHLAWGTSIKPFYRDALVDLRRAVYGVLQRTLRRSHAYPSAPSHELRLPPAPGQARDHSEGAVTVAGGGTGSAATFITRLAQWWPSGTGTSSSGSGSGSSGGSGSAHVDTARGAATDAAQSLRRAGLRPRVVIVTRNLTGGDAPGRKVAWRSEVELRQAFEDRGAKAVICCDFEVVNTVPKLLTYFGFADVCVGIHGAGLTNCAMAPPGLVLVELQGAWAFGFDGYVKLAHMAGGTYLHRDIRGVPLHHGLGAGAVLDGPAVAAVADAALGLYLAQQRSHRGRHGPALPPSPTKADLEEQYLHRTKTYRTSRRPPGHGKARQGKKQARERRESRPEGDANAAEESADEGDAEIPAAGGPRGGRRRLAAADKRHDVAAAMVLPAGWAGDVGDAAALPLPQAPAAATPFHATPPAQAAYAANKPTLFAPPAAAELRATMLPGSPTKRDFWLFVPPSVAADRPGTVDPVQVLGPPLGETTERCRALPYYKLRLMTKAPQEHKYACDAHVLLRKANNTLNDQLLSLFVHKPPPKKAEKRGKRGRTRYRLHKKEQ